MKKAIVVYLDDNPKMEEEFSWLYKTWRLYSLENEYDLVVYYNPSVKSRLNIFPKITPIEMPNIRMSSTYKFLNSHYFCFDEWSEPLKKYDYILKTDCDVFLTENLKGYTPSKFLVGEGGYYKQDDDKKINYIKKICSDTNLKYKHMSCIGASFFGKTHEVISVTKLQAVLTELILKKYSKEDEFTEVGFKRGISSMIAGEIAINHIFTQQHVILYGLDSKCWESTKIGSDVLHIHAWHTNEKWSKHDFFRGEYNNWHVQKEDAFRNSANYCQWIATTSIDEINKLKSDYHKGILNTNYDI